MSEVLERVDKLSPERQALLHRILRQKVAEARPPDAIRPRGGDAPAPLSFAQQRLWLIDQVQPENPAYNMPVSLRLGGPLDAGALERALGEIVRRHEVLRTTIGELDGAPAQVIAPFAGFVLPVEDLSALAAADREPAAGRRAREEAARPFDLAAGPLFRAVLLRLAADEHLLLLCMHHIVSDGWSTGVLLRELSALYGAYREGRESPLAEPPVQYADYAVWEREQLRGDALEFDLAYWRERLAGAPELLELPTDHPRPPVQTYRGATVPVELSPELLERLQALGRSEGATLYMVLLGAFQVLLGKYSGSEDVVVGSPIAGRTRKEVEELIGFFVNTLVLRTDLGGDPGFREVLGRVREATLGAYEHQEVPFEKLVAELQPERSLSHSPLFQVLFTLQNAGAGGGALPGLKVSGVEAENASAKFALSLTLGATAQGLRGGLNYGTDLFERGTVERMLGHLERVLEQVAADADVRLSRLALLGEAERALVLEAWNDTAAAFPADRCIHELFEAQAARTPGAVAVRFEEESLTYRELNERANRLARHLAGLGVGPEARVGVCLERSLEMVVSLLAVLKAGGAYVPLDPGYPAERLAYMLADSDIPVLLTQERLRGVLPARDGVRMVSVDGAWMEAAAGSVENPRSEVAPENLAYVIYTSGSTGRPKGVMNAHRGVVNRLWWMQSQLRLGGRDVVLQKTPFSFDVSVWEFFWPLQQGASLVMARPEGHRDPAYLQEAIERHRVTTVHFVPPMLQQFVEAAAVERCASLERVICSGEALPPALVERFHERFPARVELHNLYGPTEAAVDVSWWACQGQDSLDVVPIGRPIGNTRLYVLDAGLQPVPVGVPGELYIGGVQVARGYLNRPALTASRFVPDHLGPGAGSRLYATGDRARWRADGAIEYLGRLDEQVKIRGFRIEPGEIEAALRRHDGVRECVVVVRDDQPGDRRLVAYMVADPDAMDAAALREHLRRGLPEYMVPSAFVALDALPLSPNGKLDRKALPAPELAADADRYVAPRTPVEEVLAGIWAEVLGGRRIGATDNFFELGGHSLLATLVMARVREVLGVRAPLRTLFERPTVAELAEQVEALRRKGGPQLPPIVPVPREGPLPLSFAQERLWFLDQLQPGMAQYNVPTALRLEGRLDVPALERALAEVVRRHEAPRTTFRQAGSGPVQVVAPFAGWALVVEDLSALEPAAREAAAARRIADDAARPFDLAAGPLFRASLLRLADEDHLLLMCMHHVVTDWWSGELVLRELSALYGAFRERRSSPLAEPAVQYADFAVWQRAQLAGAALDGQLAWWRARLAGAPELLALPTDHPRPAVQSYRGAAEPVALPPELLEALAAVGRREGATPYMAVLAAWQALLGRYAGTDDVVVGSAVAGRTHRELEGVLGFFSNTLVLRTDLSGDPAFRDLLHRVRDTTLGAYDHQEVPFDRLVAELRPERSLSYSPLFQVMFAFGTYDGTGDGTVGTLAGLRIRGAGVPETSAKFDLNLAVAASAAGLRGMLAYRTDLFDAATIRRMVEHLGRVLRQVADDPGVRLSGLSLVDEDERRMLVEEWNRTDRPYPRGVTIHERFEAQVRSRPDALALAWGDVRLTYAELDGKANRLAHHLVRHGVRPESRVGVLLERGTDLVVSLLAVLKAGGAYVPLDPAYPPGRLALMLADAGIRVLVTASAFAAGLESPGVHAVCLDHAADALADEPSDAPESGATAANLAYIVYTSGSTGRPKGVMVGHREVVQLVVDTDYVRLAPGDRVAQASSASFDALTFEAWGALLNGATLVGIPRDVLLSPPALRETLRAEGITTLYQTTALLNPLSREEPDLFQPLREVLFGGQAVDAEAVRRILRSGKPARLLHMYGPTETTAWCSWEDVQAVDDDALTVTVGRGTGNARIYVLDAALQPAPVGVPGEAYVGGGGVVRGYLDRPALTAERFVPDPF
ncbi:MAG TPA: amino acid adenylation domain-containing protein, partial [Longimicrobium sp.]|nr:amino acid adenylation domain-containing protein [Longimicrobium sp.]